MAVIPTVPQLPGHRDLTPLGRGGHSEVYRAYQEQFDRWVAVKVLTFTLTDERSQRRFLRECRLAGRLSSHPNIVTVYDAGITPDGRPYLAMELFPEGSIADGLRSRGPFEVAEALRMGIALAGALETAHRAGVVHRDVKPANVLLTSYQQPVLADFGLSIVSERHEVSAGSDALTPYHAAPEVLERTSIAPTSDVYSLASTVYAMLAGRAAHQSKDGQDSIAALLLRILREDVPPVSRGGLPPSLAGTLQLAMARDPQVRTPSAVTFALALQDAQRELGVEITEPVLMDIPASAVETPFDPPSPTRPASPSPSPDQSASPSRSPGPPQPWLHHPAPAAPAHQHDTPATAGAPAASATSPPPPPAPEAPPGDPPHPHPGEARPSSGHLANDQGTSPSAPGSPASGSGQDPAGRGTATGPARPSGGSALADHDGPSPPPRSPASGSGPDPAGMSGGTGRGVVGHPPGSPGGGVEAGPGASSWSEPPSPSPAAASDADITVQRAWLQQPEAPADGAAPSPVAPGEAAGSDRSWLLTGPGGASANGGAAVVPEALAPDDQTGAGDWAVGGEGAPGGWPLGDSSPAGAATYGELVDGEQTVHRDQLWTASRPAPLRAPVEQRSRWFVPAIAGLALVGLGAVAGGAVLMLGGDDDGGGQGDERQRQQDGPPADAEVPQGLTAIESTAGVGLDWEGAEDEPYIVLVLSEADRPNLVPANSGSSALIPATELTPDVGYCFAVARSEDVQNAPRGQADEAFTPPTCIRGAAEDTVLQE